MREAHDILGVGADADSIEIRAAYIARLKHAHPDAGGASHEPVSDIVRAYRALRAGALHRRRHGTEPRDSVPIALRQRRGFQAPVPTASRAAWWGRSASLAVLLLAVGAGFYASSRLQAMDERFGARANAAEVIPAAGANWSDLEAVDGAVIRDAVSAVRFFAGNAGAAGLEAHSRRCFNVLAQSPTLRLLDYCLAFDSAATSSMTVSGSAAHTGTEGFFHPGTMSHRHASAVRSVAPGEPASEARHSEVEVRAVSELSRLGH